MMKKATCLTLIALFAVGFAAAQQIRTDYDRSLDFDQFETYAWMEDIQLPIPARLDAEQLDGWVRTAVEEQLATLGLKKADSAEEADLLVTYLTYLKQSMSSQEADVRSRSRLPYGHWRPFGDTVPDSRLHSEGTLILDLVDAGTKKLAWRGEVRQALKDPGNAEKVRKTIEKAAPKLFKKFPRGKR